MSRNRRINCLAVMVLLAVAVVAVSNLHANDQEPKTSLQDDAKALVGWWQLASARDSPVEYVLYLSGEKLFLAMSENPTSPLHTSVDGKYKLVEQAKRRYIEFVDPKVAEAAKIPTRIGYHVAGDRLELEFNSGSLKGKQTLEREKAKKSAPQQDRYVAYWLAKPGGKDEYRMLLITRTPLAELVKLMKLHAELENLWEKGAPGPQLLERPALTITTYKKDSIWNDGVPLKPLTRFKDLNEKDRTVEVNGVRHNYEECPLADVVRLLKAPEGTEGISRLHPPLGGMEQTARALRLLLEEQMKDDESKKK
jgi:hypothetical protein